jgi:fumarate hydratase subunit alpha
MRQVAYQQIADAVETLCETRAHELGEDVLEALKTAREEETNAGAEKILDELLENARIAEKERRPLCQDCGLAVVFLDWGAGVEFLPPEDNPSATPEDAVKAGVSEGYRRGYLRFSVVRDPLFDRSNTGDNTPPIIHERFASGDQVKLSVMLKGAGCENKSQMRIFPPTVDIEEVGEFVISAALSAGADACPPLVVGVGIGGDFETAPLLAKRSLLRKLGSKNPHDGYARLEMEWREKINASGIGPQGLGGKTTALAVIIKHAPCHIASLPVAVNIECHSHRHGTIVL